MEAKEKKQTTFADACRWVRNVMESRWRAADDGEKSRLLEREKRAIMGYEEEIASYKDMIREILKDAGLGAIDVPDWYCSAEDGIFAELYGLAGLSPWVYDETEAYRRSSSAKLIGNRLYCLIVGPAAAADLP